MRSLVVDNYEMHYRINASINLKVLIHDFTHSDDPSGFCDSLYTDHLSRLDPDPELRHDGNWVVVKSTLSWFLAFQRLVDNSDAIIMIDTSEGW